MPRAPKKPVSDRSLYLWLSAVLGVWCGITQATVGLISLGYWDHFRTGTLAVAVLLSLLVIAAHRRSDDGLAIGGVILSIVCATAATNLCWEFNSLLFPSSFAEGLGLLGFQAMLMAYAILVIRFLMAWLVIWIVALLLRPFFPQLLPRGPNDCRWCRYDQSGLPDHITCPECGKPWNPPSYHRARLRASRRAANRWANPIRVMCKWIVSLAFAAVVVSQLPLIIILMRYHGLHIEERDAQGVEIRYQYQIGGVTRSNFVIRDSSHRQVHFVITTDSEFGPGHWQFFRPIESSIYTSFPATDPQGNGLTKPLLRQPGLIPRTTVELILRTQPRQSP